MNDKEYLKSRVKVDSNGCWIWQGSTNNVYGTLGRNNIRWLSHRFSYFIHHGEIRDKNVCHKCDIPLCCNPEHLFLGAQKIVNDFYSLALMKICEPKKYAILMIRRQPFFSDPLNYYYKGFKASTNKQAQNIMNKSLLDLKD